MNYLREHWQRYVFFGLVLAAVFIWASVFALEAKDGRLTLFVFDVGQGDALFIDAGNGNQVLIDGGPDDAVLAKIGGVMPFWDRTIELVVLTHPHADHLDGLIPVLERYDIGMVVESGVNHSIPEYDTWHELVRERGVPLHIAKAGERIRVSPDAVFEVLAPLHDFVGTSLAVHDAMVVLRLTDRNARALLTGDAEDDVEREMLGSGAAVRADLLKVGHHGSKTSTTDALLGAVHPAVAVISVGAKNRYGHPYQLVLDRLSRAGVRVLRTDRDGDIVFVSNGTAFVPVHDK
ncbi:MAG: hypothetical protein A3B37_03310 [Candidatus Sungbacteria bacterium RIFCSPLOWO2_01_FULL_59_16]|uniref:Metallo-beta-lactamase domain-containing protein n=1 Tax=Candidatus Sungbacteria bacterium RIFCSPLOWO2_01_FULL_59_16 TaxID=1802280 RepID=A0A1G2L9L0_9BACT|nr:MAG: hypothetical protein A3B37_03310 [Candidatus Sungbacteria bacterium RIFCSPLOWO2_01_FULL_59_16]